MVCVAFLGGKGPPMDDPVILSACRTPIGKFRGTLSALSAPELGSVAIRAALERAGVEPGAVDEVILGNVLSAGIGQAPARQAALGAGLPASVPALTINKVCGSGLKAVMLAAQAIRAGDAEVVVAGGMESMSQAPYLLRREAPPLGDRTLVDALLLDGLICARSQRVMGQIADRLAREESLSREQQDRVAVESHRRALQARDEGRFEAEIAEVVVTRKTGAETVSADEGPRPETTLERLARLAPAFDPEGSVTPGNASMISDGASAVVVASDRAARRMGQRPLARIVSYAAAGMEPEDLFLAPVPAMRRALDRAGISMEQVDRIELNEAFAAQVLACGARLDLPGDRLNVNGGAIALGHPIGASGARVLATLVHELIRCDGRFGLASLCLGGGNAVAMVLERMTSHD